MARRRKNPGSCVRCAGPTKTVRRDNGRTYFQSVCERADCRKDRRPWSLHRKTSCESCGWTPPTVKALEVDHIIPRSEGGTDDPSNLRTLCPNCHRLKTLAERGLLAA